jgi:hypothetical protein
MMRHDLVRELHGDARVRLIVDDLHLDRLPVDPAGLVRDGGVHALGLRHRLALERAAAGHRVDRVDRERLGCRACTRG